MKRLLLLILLVIGFAASNSNAQWAEIPKPPSELNWPMTAQLNGTIYAFGGLVSATNAVSTAVYTFTPGDAAWKKLSVAMPKGKFAGYAGVVNNKIYLVGGSISTGVDGTTYEFDPVANTFTAKKAIPTKKSFFTGAVVAGKIYAINGSTGSFSGNDVNSVQIYDPAADTWANAPTTPDFSNRLGASGVVNGSIYVVAGLRDEAGFYSDQLWKGVPTPTDITWTAAASLPAALGQVTGGVAGGKLIVTGGTSNTAPPNFSNTYVYDEYTDNWTTTYALPIIATNAGPLVGVGNDLYLVGGYQNLRSFKFTLSNTKLPYGLLPVSPAFINLSPNQTRGINFTAQNLGVAPLTVNITIPDNAKSWLSTGSNLSIEPFQSASYSLNVASGSMNAGLYQATVTITTNDPSNTNIPVKISMYVLPGNIKPQPTVVLLEEGTGDWCGYCPQGAEIVQAIKDNSEPGTFIALEYHGGSTTEPMKILEGQKLIDALKIQGYPNAAIQRRMFPGEKFQMTNRGSWEQYVQDVKAETPDAPVSINIVSYSYDQSSGKVHAVVELERSLAMINDATSTIRLTTIITENGIAGQQEDYRLPSPYWTDFVWDDIVRSITPNDLGTKVSFPTPTVIDGNVFLAGDKVAVPGDKMQVTVDFTAPSVPDAIVDPANCNIVFIANVVKGSTTLGEVLQAQERPLVGSAAAVKTGSEFNFSLDQNAPNPVSSITNISYNLNERMPVVLTVHDLLGREVAHLVNATQDMGQHFVKFDASNLPSGTYVYSLNAGGKTMQKTMSVTK